MNHAKNYEERNVRETKACWTKNYIGSGHSISWRSPNYSHCWIANYRDDSVPCEG